ncbi:DUF5131 family protein [Pimelobacter simplex]|nr:phage Gp37/Gp68 family protein [Pimelobacter simplex]MCG8150217.1 DUF5131 family protein [Pimelobacter simplex]GEB13573.1 hypothetical protein NSI01_18880 [Pimelobacter simplex]SFM71515.1 protein gp37 [Pimelobacter simplex]
MSDRSNIEWTDATWNPVTGCTKVSPGCDHCYAETLAERFRGTPGHYYEQGFDVVLRPTKLEQPLRWTRPRRIFVNSMSDLFHDEISDEFIVRVFAVMALAGQHTFQLLTKRHGRMRALLNERRLIDTPNGWLSFEDAVRNVAFNERNRLCSNGVLPASTPNPDDLPWPLSNVWLGVSVENQQWADIRIPALLATPAAVRFLSMEPLLGPVELRTWLGCPCSCADPNYAADLDWVIVGGESGRGARPMQPAWVRSLRDQCVRASVAFHFKQWGSYGLANATDQPDQMIRMNKRAAGRELDGRTWDEFPEVTR